MAHRKKIRMRQGDPALRRHKKVPGASGGSGTPVTQKKDQDASEGSGAVRPWRKKLFRG